MRLIDADELKMSYEEWWDGEEETVMRYYEIEEIENAPTIDPVVHCAECVFAKIYVICGENILTCDNNEGLFRDVPPDGYCYCGAKMDGGVE